MTTTRLAIERIVLECDGASVSIVAATNEWSGREQLCIEIVTADAGNDDVNQRDGDGDDTAPALALYCPPPEPPRRTAVSPGSRRRRRAGAATAVAAVAAAVALLTAVAGTRIHSASASRETTAPTSVPADARSDSGNDPDRTDTPDHTLVAASADLASRCSHMIDAAAVALGIDDASLLNLLVADHVGQTLNDAVRQELTDARAVLASQLGRADAAARWTVSGLDRLDAAIADVDTTPCSPRDGIPSPLPVSGRVK